MRSKRARTGMYSWQAPKGAGRPRVHQACPHVPAAVAPKASTYPKCTPARLRSHKAAPFRWKTGKPAPALNATEGGEGGERMGGGGGPHSVERSRGVENMGEGGRTYTGRAGTQNLLADEPRVQLVEEEGGRATSRRACPLPTGKPESMPAAHGHVQMLGSVHLFCAPCTAWAYLVPLVLALLGIAPVPTNPV